MKTELAIIGIILASIHWIFDRNFNIASNWAWWSPFFGTVLGAMVAIMVLALGEALKDRKTQ